MNMFLLCTLKGVCHCVLIVLGTTREYPRTYYKIIIFRASSLKTEFTKDVFYTFIAIGIVVFESLNVKAKEDF